MRKRLINETAFELDECSRKILQYKLIEVIFQKLYRENEITENEYHRFIKVCKEKIKELLKEWEVLNGR